MLFQCCAKKLQIRIHLALVKSHPAQDIAAVHWRTIDRKPGTIRAAMLLCSHQGHKVFTNRAGSVQNPPCNTTHAPSP